MWVMSGFADEIDPDPATPCAVLDEHGVGVSSVGSPLREVDDTDGVDEHLGRMDRAVEVAGALGAAAHHPGGFSGPDEVTRATKAFVTILDAEGVEYR